MRAVILSFSLLAAACASAPPPDSGPPSRPAPAPSVDLPWSLVELDNGLRLLMQPDRSMAEVGVEVWIRGGSREEERGQFGVAHLFEHNVPPSGRFLSNPENQAARSRGMRAGGAGTQPDFLRFYTTVSPEALEAALGFLADRLESDPSRFTEETLRRDQDVVVSELRRSMGVDWNVAVQARLQRGTFGIDHPYGHSVQGSEEDVRAATVELMRDWHRRFAGAANAIVFVVGNFDPVEAEAMVRRHYGPIDPGTVAPRFTAWVPPARPISETMEMDLPQGVVYLRWPVPGWGTPDGDLLTLLAHVLNRRLPSGLSARIELHEITGAFTLRGDVPAGTTPAAVSGTLHQELERVLREGPTEAEIERVKAQQQTDFLQMLQRPVWRFSRADALGFGLLFRGNPDAYQQELARIAAATPSEVQAAGVRWLSARGYELHVVPRPRRAATGAIDRAASIAPRAATAPVLPAVTDFSTSGGLRVLLAERPSIPLATVTFVAGAGWRGELESARARAEERLSDLGAQTSLTSDADFAKLSLVVVRERLEAALGILATALAGADPQRSDPPPPQSTEPMRIREQLLASLLGEASAQSGLFFVTAAGDVRQDVLREALAPLTISTPPAVPARSSELPPGTTKVVNYAAATQSHILLAQPLRNVNDPLMAHFVAYALRSRLMANLRSDKGWSYEIYPFRADIRRTTAALRFHVPVQTTKTAESITEIIQEIRRLREELVSEEFLASIKGHVMGEEVTGGLTSLQRLSAQLVELGRLGLPSSWYASAAQRLESVTAEDLRAAAVEMLHPEGLIWIIAGPQAEVTRELGEIGVQPQ